MLRTKKVDRIVYLTTVAMLLVAACLWACLEPLQGIGKQPAGCESLLFDQNKVHTIDITMAGWDDFIARATAEEYAECNLVINGERINNVAIRAKGNISLSSVAAMGSTRYSFKVEFDHYVKGSTYHGLDKLSLNNLIQDATMMKDYLSYTLMNRAGVPSPLCSYVQISVNGEPWGLYLAVEGIEKAFMDRNGMTRGALYKPDSISFGGGRGNAGDFEMEQFRVKDGASEQDAPSTRPSFPFDMPFPAKDGTKPSDTSTDNSAGVPMTLPQMPPPGIGSIGGIQDTVGGTSAIASPESTEQQGERIFSERPGAGGFGGFNFGIGNDDVKLIYTDDNPDNYKNIFENAKTTIKKKDKTRLIEALRRLNAKEDIENTVNQDEVIRYLAAHHFLCNDDSYTGMMVHNYYLYEEKGKLSIIPWDYNLGFGGFSASSDATFMVNSPIDSPVSGGTVDSRPLVAWIFSEETSLADYHAAYDRFILENIESGWLKKEISRVQTMITPYLKQDASAFYNMEEFEKAVDTLQIFCQKRGDSIRGQLNGTIPSTTQEQQVNSGALIDASDISIADMGSMNTGMSGFDNSAFPKPPGMGGGMPDFFNPGGFTPPSGFPQFPPQGENNSLSPSAGDGAASTPSQASAVPNEKTGAQEEGANNEDSSLPFIPKEIGKWVQPAAWSIVLLAAIFLIRRVGNHNS